MFWEPKRGYLFYVLQIQYIMFKCLANLFLSSNNSISIITITIKVMLNTESSVMITYLDVTGIYSPILGPILRTPKDLEGVASINIFIII